MNTKSTIPEQAGSSARRRVPLRVILLTLPLMVGATCCGLPGPEDLDSPSAAAPSAPALATGIQDGIRIPDGIEIQDVIDAGASSASASDAGAPPSPTAAPAAKHTGKLPAPDAGEDAGS